MGEFYRIYRIYEVTEAYILVCKTLYKKYNTPWMNRDALKSIKDKRKKWNKFLNSKNEIKKNNYQESKLKATKDTKS